MQGSVEQKVNPDQNLIIEDIKQEEMEEAIDHDHSDYDEEEEFSFMFGEANTSPIAAEDAFINGQIKPIFPLFNTALLLSNNDLPIKPLVKKVFVETIEENDEISGPYCDWSNGTAVELTAASSSEVCKKSNSTGFSKIWRFRDLMGRSNSEGRDAFVFVNNTHAPPPVAEKPVEKESTVRVNRNNVKKSKTVSLSAHEVYLRSKAKEDERRKSYLPYRPELMGFFTNVNGGLTKNVHPY
ncbi:hypothetical protein ACJIZ3_005138 [Penstemon smallii]|uniref:Uncharacterized protein n=1 Tax=Penstemon smallii TaxID=265156 RepID=A0ABD3S421_9LAMI